MTIRKTARAIIADNNTKCILLFQIQDPSVFNADTPQNEIKWITPGGKIEEGENLETAILREIQEETGLLPEDIELGPQIWHGTHELMWKEALTKLDEYFFIAWVNKTDVSFSQLTDDEKAVYKNYKWWSVDELATTEQTILPPNMGTLLSPILAKEYPGIPIEISLATAAELAAKKKLTEESLIPDSMDEALPSPASVMG